MNDLNEKLYSLVAENVPDIIEEYAPKSLRSKSFELSTTESGNDDGTVYGVYEIVVGRHELVITVSASASYESEEESYDYSRESVRTKRSSRKELYDYDQEILDVVKNDTNAI